MLSLLIGFYTCFPYLLDFIHSFRTLNLSFYTCFPYFNILDFIHTYLQKSVEKKVVPIIVAHFHRRLPGPLGFAFDHFVFFQPFLDFLLNQLRFRRHKPRLAATAAVAGVACDYFTFLIWSVWVIIFCRVWVIIFAVCGGNHFAV
jgi:hypothetical protein